MYNHKPLAKTCLFWCALCAPLAVGGFLAMMISIYSDLGVLCWESECVQTFFDYFKFPLTIVGISLPLVAMAAAIHRSREAALQIEYVAKQYGELIKNNRFGNYLKHRETFEKLVDSFCKRHGENIQKNVTMQSHRLYVKLFPASGYGRLDWAGEHDEVFWEKVELKAAEAIAEVHKSKDEFDLEKFVRCLGYLIRNLEIFYQDFMSVSCIRDGEEVYSVHVESDEDMCAALFYSLTDVLSVVMMLRGFVGKNDFSDLLLGLKSSVVIDLIEAGSDSLSVERYK